MLGALEESPQPVHDGNLINLCRIFFGENLEGHLLEKAANHSFEEMV